MFVQFIGPPGAGKTNLIMKTAEAIQVKVVDLGYGAPRTARGTRLGRLARVCVWLWSVLSRPRVMWNLRRAISSRESLRLALEICRRDRELRNLSDLGVLVLVDEGPLHRLGWLLAVSGWRGNLDAVTASLSTPGALVHVVGDPEAALLRVEERGATNALLRSSREEALATLEAYNMWATRLTESTPQSVVAQEPRELIEWLRRQGECPEAC